MESSLLAHVVFRIKSVHCRDTIATVNETILLEFFVSPLQQAKLILLKW